MRNTVIVYIIVTLVVIPSCLFAQTDSIRFDTAVFLSGSSQTTSVITADFNKDSHLELMAGSSINASFYFFQDTGSGQFGPALATNSVIGNIYCMAQADFDTNGTIDIAIANYSDVYLLDNDGSANFTLKGGDSLRATAPSQMIAADLNDDGLPDIITANYNNESVSVLMNLDSAKFDTASIYSVGVNPGGVCVLDFDHDGNLDLAVPCTNSKAVYLLRGKGDGTFYPSTFFGLPLHYACVVAAGDFNKDGFDDLAVANLVVGRPAWLDIFLNDGTGAFSLHEMDTVDVQARDVVAGDFDKDNNLDLAVSCLDSGYVCLLRGKGNGSFGQAARYQVGGRVLRICVGDFNQDTYPDIAASSWFGDASVLINKSGAPMGVDDGDRTPLVPTAFLLRQNYPNPFNPTTTISFVLPSRADVTIDVYNVLGQRVRKLDLGVMGAGAHSTCWNGRDSEGKEAPSGIYFYTLTAGQFHETKKMVLLK